MIRHISFGSVAIKTVFSALFGLVMMTDRRIVVYVTRDKLLTPNADNYVGPVSVASIVTLVITFAVVFALLTGAERLASSGSKWVFRSQFEPPARRWFWIFAAILSFAWLPWLISNLPGGIFYDTYTVYHTINGNLPLNNQQPIFYTGFNALVFWIVRSVFHGSTEIAAFTMTMIQYSFMALSLAYFAFWLLKNQVSRVVTSIVLSYFALFPLFSYYASSNWKDTWFSLTIFLFAVKLVDVVRTQGKILCFGKDVLHYVSLAFMICWFRNNGIYVVVVTTICLLVMYRRVLVMSYFKRRESVDGTTRAHGFLKVKLPLFLMSATVLIVGTGVLQGPVFSSIGWNENQAVETYGIPIQQVCSVIANNGKISDEERAVFDKIISPEVAAVYFSPNGVDSVKANMGVPAREYLNTHQGDFLKVWISVVIKNPTQVINAYLLTTLGFWDPARGHNAGYIQQGLAPGGEQLGLTPHDLIYKITGHSFNQIYAPRYYISSALFCWLALFFAVVLVLRRKFALLLPFVPLMALWGTIMLTVPIAYSLRYVYAYVPFLALAVVIAFGSERWIGGTDSSAEATVASLPATPEEYGGNQSVQEIQSELKETGSAT